MLNSGSAAIKAEWLDNPITNTNNAEKNVLIVEPVPADSLRKIRAAIPLNGVIPEAF